MVCGAGSAGMVFDVEYDIMVFDAEYDIMVFDAEYDMMVFDAEYDMMAFGAGNSVIAFSEIGEVVTICLQFPISPLFFHTQTGKLGASPGGDGLSTSISSSSFSSKKESASPSYGFFATTVCRSDNWSRITSFASRSNARSFSAE